MKKSDKVINKAISKAVKDGKIEIVVREGAAEQIREKKLISITGTIQAPLEFWMKRHHIHKHHSPDKTNIIFSKTDKKIILNINENSFFSKTITGVLKINPELDEFKINKDFKYTVKGLADFLKMRKFFFKDRDQATKIVTNLQKFKASIQTQIEEFDNLRGNSKQMFEAKTDSNLDLSFTLKMPVFKGQPDKNFKVEINFDVRDKQVDIWLESEELRFIELNDIDLIFEKELKMFQAANVVCIEQ